MTNIFSNESSTPAPGNIPVAGATTGKIDAGYLPSTGGGVTTFTGLSDVPNSYTGAALHVVRVNAASTALEFVTLAAGGDMLKATYDPGSTGKIAEAQLTLNYPTFDHVYSALTSTPNTVSGYGITNLTRGSTPAAATASR